MFIKIFNCLIHEKVFTGHEYQVDVYALGDSNSQIIITNGDLRQFATIKQPKEVVEKEINIKKETK